MDSPSSQRSACSCLWQALKKKRSDERRSSKNTRFTAYYGDWGMDENIYTVNSNFPKKEQESLKKEKEKEIIEGKD